MPKANIKKLQNAIVKNGTPEEMRKFAINIHGSNKNFLEAWAKIGDIFNA